MILTSGITTDVEVWLTSVEQLDGLDSDTILYFIDYFDGFMLAAICTIDDTHIRYEKYIIPASFEELENKLQELGAKGELYIRALEFKPAMPKTHEYNMAFGAKHKIEPTFTEAKWILHVGIFPHQNFD